MAAELTDAAAAALGDVLMPVDGILACSGLRERLRGDAAKAASGDGESRLVAPALSSGRLEAGGLADRGQGSPRRRVGLEAGRRCRLSKERCSTMSYNLTGELQEKAALQ